MEIKEVDSQQYNFDCKIALVNEKYIITEKGDIYRLLRNYKSYKEVV